MIVDEANRQGKRQVEGAESKAPSRRRQVEGLSSNRFSLGQFAPRARKQAAAAMGCQASAAIRRSSGYPKRGRNHSTRSCAVALKKLLRVCARPNHEARCGGFAPPPISIS